MKVQYFFLITSLPIPLKFCLFLQSGTTCPNPNNLHVYSRINWLDNSAVSNIAVSKRFLNPAAFKGYLANKAEHS